MSKSKEDILSYDELAAALSNFLGLPVVIMGGNNLYIKKPNGESFRISSHQNDWKDYELLGEYINAGEKI